MDLSTFQALGESLQGATQLAKALMDIRDHAEISRKSGELYAQVVTAHAQHLETLAAYHAALRVADEAHKRVAELENFERDRVRYELKDPREQPRNPSVLVYSLKAGMEGGDPPHHLCPNCYQKSVKSILQGKQQGARGAVFLVCHACGKDFLLRGVDHSDRPRFAQT
jgi:hypothetical protein